MPPAPIITMGMGRFGVGHACCKDWAVLMRAFSVNSTGRCARVAMRQRVKL